MPYFGDNLPRYPSKDSAGPFHCRHIFQAGVLSVIREVKTSAPHIVFTCFWSSRVWAKMYYVPEKENSLGMVNTLKFSWDMISGIHCLLLPQHYEICLGIDISYLLFTTSPRKTLDELSRVVSRIPDPVRKISRSSS